MLHQLKLTSVLQQTLPNILTTASDSLRQLSQAEDAGDDAFMQQLRSMLGEGDDNVVDTLTKHANAIENDVVEAKQRLDSCRREVDEIWSDDQENEYELSSVFIHLGAAGYGHYYCELQCVVALPFRMQLIVRTCRF